MRNLLTLAILGIGLWYYFGPFQSQQPDTSVRYQQQLEQNKKDLGRCMRAKDYVEGATGNSPDGGAEQSCASRLGLYLHEGKWHSYDDARPEAG